MVIKAEWEAWSRVWHCFCNCGECTSWAWKNCSVNRQLYNVHSSAQHNRAVKTHFWIPNFISLWVVEFGNREQSLRHEGLAELGLKALVCLAGAPQGLLSISLYCQSRWNSTQAQSIIQSAMRGQRRDMRLHFFYCPPYKENTQTEVKRFPVYSTSEDYPRLSCHARTASAFTTLSLCMG